MEKELRKNLFIIGNGFDIAHGIPSRYSDFQKYIRSLYMTEELIDKSYDSFTPWKYSVPRTNNINGHFDIKQPYVLNNILGFLDYCIARSEHPNAPYNFYINSDWRSIEEVLGKLDLEEFFSEEFNYYDINSSGDNEWTLYDIAECFKFLEALTSMWAKTIDVSNARPIKSFLKLIHRDRLLPINNDFFVSFNYTPTLEHVYEVTNVVHVHGIAGERVMLGHDPNIDIDRFCQKNAIPESCRHAAKVLLEVTQKDTEKIATILADCFKYNCAGVTDIYSYGFSFADVDLPYITLICNSIDTKLIKWHLLDFDSKEQRKKYADKIQQCGFKGSFSTYHVETGTSKKKKKKSSPCIEYKKAKIKHMGRSRYYLEQILLMYNTINYQPTKLDTILFIPRVLRCLFFILIENMTVDRHNTKHTKKED
ncbi:Bacteriophage abortive infection AbiH [Sarcina sp. DSM 11001]|uniref:AbiH family protein n=1 Tax=Sarcina sp. DSM 11001 TaxID=1798184 RepID=UPI000888FD47|nr:AbiH family protein [Sarcina sp. DSM 11001]SDL82134.1 Bacteriophage abortive infection AbiH [Sarcina sp. DSM 11001]